MPVAFNPYDQDQQRFLSALSLSEVGGAKNAQFLGTGGTDLADAPRDQYGFPQWGGFGDSHAAGFFQFQPGTWERYASQYDLDFQNAADQKAGAWYDAQDTYRRETGGDLSAALSAGDYGKIEDALGKSEWLGARGKLAMFLSGGKGAALPDGTGEVSEDTSGFSWQEVNPFRNPFTKPGEKVSVKESIERFLLFGVGALILFAATWWLLSGAGVVPSAKNVVRSVAAVA